MDDVAEGDLGGKSMSDEKGGTAVGTKKTTTPADEKEAPRIGVYVCHCGLNIAGSVDCKAVADYARTLPGVVASSDNRYTCSEPGQEIIKKEIKELKLNRVVVASCTPRLHEPTFRTACKDAGLNPYLFEMANLREHCSWVHLHDREAATAKAKDLVKMAVARAALLEAQEEAEVPVIRKSLVIGGGVAGIQAALDLAQAGYKVFLIEKEPSIGGKMAQIDKTFPTMDCSICILAPKMAEAGRHPNITLLANSDVTDVKGYIGNFKVHVKKRARYVTKDCTACGDCSKVCPVVVPNEFDIGLASRHAIYTPFAQAVPSTYIIDKKNCLGTIICRKCTEKCERKSIDFDMTDEEVDLDVGTIIVATGVDAFDPSALVDYNYGKYPNVITSLEFERLINAGGPSGGKLIRPSDMTIPKEVAFIQCVGSRKRKDSKGHPYCSNICCMNTIKDSLLIKEHWPDTNITVYYMDIRAFGKGFEDLYNRSKEHGVKFIRGLPAEIDENLTNQNLVIRSEDTDSGKLIKKEFGMVVLSIGIEPRADNDVVQKLLTLSRTSDGFFLEAHPKLRPVDAPTPGIFLCGCAEGPKDIKDSVTQASAAAARANILMAQGRVKVEALTPVIIEENCKKCGACAKVCPYHAIDFNRETKEFPKVITAACAGCGTCGAECAFNAITMRHFSDESIIAEIDAITSEDACHKTVAFCCNWCSYAGADFAGVGRMQYPPEIRIIRTMCSGRVAEKFVIRAFQRGAGAVLVAGCHLQDCHYINANYQTLKRVERMWTKMEKKGLRKERLQLAWISAAEGEKFASKVKEMAGILKTVTKKECEDTQKLLESGKL
jgi:heterodisulfide reductase subunit A